MQRGCVNSQAVVFFALGEAGMSRGVIIIADREIQETDVIADLNALFLMIECDDIELERTAPGCVPSV